MLHPTNSTTSDDQPSVQVESSTLGQEGSFPTGAHEPGVTSPSPEKHSTPTGGGNRGNSGIEENSPFVSSQQSTNSTEPSVLPDGHTGTERTRRGRVTLQSCILAEIHIDVEVDATGLAAEVLAQRAALGSLARREWDIVSESCARALRRHLIERVNIIEQRCPAVGLVVTRQCSGEMPELLVLEIPEDDDGSA